MSSALLFITGAFLTTYLIELLIVWLFLRKKCKGIWFDVLLINLLTWPLVQAFYTGTENSFALLEVGAIVVEGVTLKYLSKVRWRRVALAAIIANIVSALVGLSGLFLF